MNPADLDFLLGTVVPETSDRAALETLALNDDQFRASIVESDEVFRQVIDDEEILLKISPVLYFEVLLRRARKELESATFTLEPNDGQYIPVFDVPEVVELLGQTFFLDYLSQMLTSFVRINSHTVSVRVRKGIRRRTRYNDMDIDSLIRFGAVADEGSRFAYIKRIADVCLFSAGMFPKSNRHQNHAASSATRMTPRTFEDFVETGRRFYGLAKRNPAAQKLNIAQTFDSLEEHFTSALKPLTFISTHYLHSHKNRLFRP